MRTSTLIAVTTLLLPGAAASQQARRYSLDSVAGLRLHNVSAEQATLDGKRGVRLMTSPETLRRMQAMTVEQQTQVELLALLEGLEFSSGVIEAEVAGVPGEGAGAGARGFVGIAFRLQPDMQTYDAFYLRPTNGRAEDQERRNHATQYISHPAWPWFRLRQESPSKYEAYADLVPGAWTKIRIEVHGDRARLFVQDNPQPTLIVNDVKSGASARGGVALWLGPGTVAHFRNVVVTPEGAASPTR